MGFGWFVCLVGSPPFFPTSLQLANSIEESLWVEKSDKGHVREGKEKNYAKSSEAFNHWCRDHRWALNVQNHFREKSEH